MKKRKKSDLAVLLDYAGSYRRLTFLGLGLSAVSMVLSIVPYISIWLVARDLILAAGPGQRACPPMDGWRLPRRWAASSCILQVLCAPIWQLSAQRPTSAGRALPT